VKLRFDAFVLDTDTRQLFGADGERHLTPKALDLLAFLLENRPNAIAKKDLQDRLWPDTFVTDANLAILIAEIRTALGDSARQPRYIRTVHRFGYAFASAATAVSAAQPAATSRLQSAACWLTSKRQRFPLEPGEHIVGRLPDADIHVDHESVSRRHARVVVTREGATVEDLGSKNGTYVRTDRITAPTALEDRDRVRFGSVSLTFRSWSIGATTRSVTPPLQA
jgi:DNA-binding winged helix-turn-helix (wHTH) protein